MNERTPASAIEARWPVVLAILTLLVLLVALPDRIRLVPMWVHCGIVGVFLMPIVAVGLTAGRAPWPRIERTTTFAFFVAVAIATSVNLGYRLGEMLVRSDGVSGMQLLTSSIGLWATNVVNFSVLYWQVDGGGPEARRSPAGRLPDWLFPQAGVPEQVPVGWRPKFVDYLFLGFCTSTAFSPTEAIPLTSRAKLLMMVQSTFSLVTIVAVAARAINILGST